MLIELSGVTHHDKDRATPGFTLFSPIQSDRAYLVNKDGDAVHEWAVHGRCTNWCELLPNGNLWMNEAGSTQAPVPFGARVLR